MSSLFITRSADALLGYLVVEVQIWVFTVQRVMEKDTIGWLIESGKSLDLDKGLKAGISWNLLLMPSLRRLDYHQHTQLARDWKLPTVQSLLDTIGSFSTCGGNYLSPQGVWAWSL